MGSTAKNFFEGFQNIYVGKLRSEDKFMATFLCIKALECLLIQKHHLVLSSTFDLHAAFILLIVHAGAHTPWLQDTFFVFRRCCSDFQVQKSA